MFNTHLYTIFYKMKLQWHCWIKLFHIPVVKPSGIVKILVLLWIWTIWVSDAHSFFWQYSSFKLEEQKFLEWTQLKKAGIKNSPIYKLQA